MKALTAIFLLACASTCFAQTKTISPTKAKLNQCEADLKSTQAARDSWPDLYARLSEERAKLEIANKELESQNSELNKKMDAIKQAAAELLKDDKELYPAVAKMQTDYGDLVKKYNSLLDIARSQDAQLRLANSRQQRFNNALAIYSQMPRPTQQINLQVSDCTKLPALCVH